MNEPEYIRFVDISFDSSGKTKVWNVVAKDDETNILGEIRWVPEWQCYSFFSEKPIFGRSLYHEVSLREVDDFCKEQTKLHREDKKK